MTRPRVSPGVRKHTDPLWGLRWSTCLRWSPLSQGPFDAGLKNQAADLRAWEECGASEPLSHQAGDSWGFGKGCGQGDGRQERARPEMQRAPGRGSGGASALSAPKPPLRRRAAPSPGSTSSAPVPGLQISGLGGRGDPAILGRS